LSCVSIFGSGLVLIVEFASIHGRERSLALVLGSLALGVLTSLALGSGAFLNRLMRLCFYEICIGFGL
jgi:hypothetical protein